MSTSHTRARGHVIGAACYGSRDWSHALHVGVGHLEHAHGVVRTCMINRASYEFRLGFFGVFLSDIGLCFGENRL